MLRADDFRGLALALPDTVEGAHQGHPDFRTNGRVFASLHPDGLRAMVKVGPTQQSRLVRSAPGTYAPASGAWGRAGCTMVTLATAAKDDVQQALVEAWQAARAQPKARARRPR